MIKIIRYLVSGLAGLAVNLGTLRALVALGLHYLIASIIAFCIAMIVGFLLQKFWTFQSRALERAHVQFSLYALLALCNLALNTGIVFALVAWLGIYYLLAQAIAAGLVALISFGVYTRFIFKTA